MTFPRRVIELFDVLSAPLPSLSLSLFRSSLSLRYNDPLSTRVHQAFNVLHQFFSSFLFLPPLARSLRRFADYSTTRRRRERERERERERKGKACRLQAGRETGWRGSKQADLPPSVSFSPIHFADVACWMTSGAQSCQRREGATTPVHCHHVGGWNFLLMRDKLFLWPFLSSRSNPRFPSPPFPSFTSFSSPFTGKIDVHESFPPNTYLLPGFLIGD